MNAPPPPTLTERAARGAAWALAGRGLSQAAGFVLSLVLLRLLSPSDFGLAAMAAAILYVLADTRDLRLADALIQKSDPPDAAYTTVFALHVGVGLALSLAFAAAAPLLAWFYDAAPLRGVAAALGFRLFLESLSDVSRARLVRRMAFSRIALADVASLVVSGGVAVFLALRGKGPWALVALNLVGASVSSAILIVSEGWLPSGRVAWDSLRGLRRFSGFLYGARNLAALGRHLDKVLVGRFLGDMALGLYDRGFQLMRLPLERVAEVVTRVMYAALSELQDDLPRLREAYVRSARMLSLIVFPAAAGLAVTAQEFILAVGGDKWRDAAPIIRILCVAALPETLLLSAAWIFFARGRTDREFLWTCITLVIAIAAVAAGLPFGVAGVAWAYLARTLLLTAATCTAAYRLIGLRWAVMVRALAPILGATVAMSAAAIGTRALGVSRATLGVWPLLGIEVLAGAVVYVGTLALLRAEAFVEARGLLAGFLRRAARPSGQ